MVKKTFNLDDETIEKIAQDSQALHIGKSAFLRFLVWSYNRNKSDSNFGG